MPHDRRDAAPQAANDEASALAALKSLLVGPEQESIRRLDREIHDPEGQVERVSGSLTDALDLAYRNSPNELIRALDRPVAECLRGSVRREPGFFADILYPVMGPAIRRSITQAMKGLVQQINQTLEHSLTLKGLRWRFQAARSGVPFAEIVLRNTLRYRVDEVFLIQGRSGLLIKHLTQGDKQARDPDAVSGMLTAIRDFAGDTFDQRAGTASRLETIDVGDHTLWLVHGPQAYLACAIRGIAPVGLRDEFAGVVETIHRDHAEVLTGFGDDAGLADRLRPLLETCLKAEWIEPSRRRFPWPLTIVALAILAGLAWWVHGLWQADSADKAQRALMQAAVERLQTTPGTLVTDWRIDEDGRLLLQGLHDPLTTSPAEVLAASGLAPSAYAARFAPYQSPVPALARARLRLAPPDTVSLTLDRQGTLVATGVADDAWIERAGWLALTVPGIVAYDASGLERREQRLLRDLLAQLRLPAGVELAFADGVARLEGVAPLDWIGTLPQRVDLAEGGVDIDATALRPLEASRAEALRERIEQTRIAFGTDVALGPEQRAQIDALATAVAELHRHASRLGWRIRLHLIGRTDGIGTPEQNLFIARDRAIAVAQALGQVLTDVPDLDLVVIAQPSLAVSSVPDLALRRVEFRVSKVPGGPDVRPLDR